MKLTKEKFGELYPDLAQYYEFFSDRIPEGTTNEQFERKYLQSKLWRLNNLYKIIDKHGNAVTFKMNHAQHMVYAASRLHPRLIILKSRQQGISTLWLVSLFDDVIFCPYISAGLMAQGVDEASTLLERTKFLWDNLDEQVKQFLNVKLVQNNSKAFALNNNSKMFIRVSFRSTTLQRLHISEFGKIANHSPKKAKEVKTGTLQALATGNTGVIESTAEGRNDFKAMWDEAVSTLHSGQIAPKDFYPVFLSWLDDPDCVEHVPQTISAEHQEYFDELERKTSRVLCMEQKWFWVRQARELGGDIFQEYPATPEEAFTAAKDGTYYAKQYMEVVVRANKRERGLYDPNLPIDVYFDLGVDDYFVMGFVQWYQGEWRIIDEYWNNGYALAHYIEHALESGYKIRAMKFPHDIAVRELGSSKSNGLAKSRLEIARELLQGTGIKCLTLDKLSVADGIEAVRRMLPRMRIDTKCAYLHDCLLNYSKEWDDKLEVWKKTPLHNEYSHGADLLRQIAAQTVENSSYNGSSYDRQTTTYQRGHAV